VEATLKLKLELPNQVIKILDKPKLSIPISDYKALKNYLLEH